MNMKKILVAEDDAVSQRIVCEVVNSMGYFPILASDGQIAWKILNDNPDISLLITDLMMPELTGQELVRLIRGNESFSDLPVIMISAVVGLSEIVNVLELGASRFLPKPLHIQELRSYITTLIGDED